MGIRFTPGMPVWARRAHGLLNRIPRGSYGQVWTVRDTDGRVVVTWASGRTTAADPTWLGIGADIEPHVAELIENALADADDRCTLRSAHIENRGRRKDWMDGWTAAVDEIRDSLVHEGAITDSNLSHTAPRGA